MAPVPPFWPSSKRTWVQSVHCASITALQWPGRHWFSFLVPVAGHEISGKQVTSSDPIDLFLVRTEKGSQVHCCLYTLPFHSLCGGMKPVLLHAWTSGNTEESGWVCLHYPNALCIFYSSEINRLISLVHQTINNLCAQTDLIHNSPMGHATNAASCLL